jgi:hypothetical protein
MHNKLRALACNTDPGCFGVIEAFRSQRTAQRWIERSLEPLLPTPVEYHQRAKECLQLAGEAEEFFVKAALIELAAEFEQMAESQEEAATVKRIA